MADYTELVPMFVLYCTQCCTVLVPNRYYTIACAVIMQSLHCCPLPPALGQVSEHVTDKHHMSSAVRICQIYSSPIRSYILTDADTVAIP